jgi:hypothetical protein
LVDSMTWGEQKSLSGLDDTKVLKGRENFIALRTLVKDIVTDQLSAKALLKRIDECEDFYKTDFTLHLKEKGDHRCRCVTCGFHDKGTCSQYCCDT